MFFGTWDLVKDLWGNPDEVSERVHSKNGMLALNYWQPSTRFPAVMGYYTATALIQKALIDIHE